MENSPLSAVNQHAGPAPASELIDALRRRTDEAEQLRRLPDDTIRELESSGLLSSLVPESSGGREAEMSEVIDAVRRLAHGCTSTAWIGGFFMVHAWILSLYPERARSEVFGDGPGPTAAGPFAPAGRAEPVDGGVRLRGRWSWASGIMHADWAMVGAIVEGDATVDAIALLLVPVDELEIVDVWHTSGMRGTGSNDIVIDDVFVPEHRRLSFVSLINGTTPGASAHENPLYRWPMVPVLAFAAAAPAVGTAERLIDDFRSQLGERILAYTGERQGTKPAAQMRLAQATVRMAAVRALTDRTLDELQEAVMSGAVTRDVRARSRLVAAHAVHESRQVVQVLSEASGGHAHFCASPFQRALRDVNTLAGHVIFDYDSTTELYGAVDLGLEVSPTALL